MIEINADNGLALVVNFGDQVKSIVLDRSQLETLVLQIGADGLDEVVANREITPEKVEAEDTELDELVALEDTDAPLETGRTAIALGAE